MLKIVPCKKGEKSTVEILVLKEFIDGEETTDWGRKFQEETQRLKKLLSSSFVEETGKERCGTCDLVSILGSLGVGGRCDLGILTRLWSIL